MKNLKLQLTIGTALLFVTACGGENGDDDSGDVDVGSQGAELGSGGVDDFPELTEAKTPGMLTGTIGDNSLDVEGVCSTAPDSFNFWTDGTDFASNNDVNGDGQYVTIQMINTGDVVMTALRFSKNDETVYNGQIPVEAFDGSMMQVDSALGREQAINADFTIECE